MSKRKLNSGTISVKCNSEDYKRIYDAAFEENKTRSEFARSIILNYLDRNEKKEEFKVVAENSNRESEELLIESLFRENENLKDDVKEYKDWIEKLKNDIKIRDKKFDKFDSMSAEYHNYKVDTVLLVKSLESQIAQEKYYSLEVKKERDDFSQKINLLENKISDLEIEKKRWKENGEKLERMIVRLKEREKKIKFAAEQKERIKELREKKTEERTNTNQTGVK